MFIIRTYRINRITRNIWLPICCLDTQIGEDYLKTQSVYVFDPEIVRTNIMCYSRNLHDLVLLSRFLVHRCYNFEQDASSFRVIIKHRNRIHFGDEWKAERWIRDEWKERVTPFITRTILGIIYWTLPHIEQMAFL